ncbi:MAG: hypothetical protein U9N77_00275 [Thermodesulfobacteriota bacterium]|nr:hypothetical protein [Thermodesulfobacteriota bacterium]
MKIFKNINNIMNKRKNAIKIKGCEKKMGKVPGIIVLTNAIEKYYI